MLLYYLNLEYAYKDNFNKLNKVFTSSSLEANLSKTKIMIFICNKRELNQKFYFYFLQIQLK